MRLLLSAIIAGVLAGPVSAARLDLVTSVPLVRARQIDFQGDYAWVAQNMDGATLLNIADPQTPVKVRQFTPEEMQPLFLKVLPEEDLLLSADRFQGLVVYDVSTPDSPTTVSLTPLPPMTTHLDVTETTDGRRLAVLARGGEGVMCVDISDPATPQITDRFGIGAEFTRAVAVADGIVYAADSAEGGLKALRLVSPGLFQPLYQANLFGTCDSLLADGEHLFVGYLNRGFRIFELPDAAAVETETSPVVTLVSSVLRNRSRVRAMVRVDDALVLANDQIGVDMYNVANPALPWLSHEFVFKDRGVLAQSCALYRKNLYVPAWEAGLLIFRITDQPVPEEYNLENLQNDE